MARYLLDTNVVSELRRRSSRRIDPSVLAWAESLADDAGYLSSMTVFELELGTILLERRDPKQAQHLRTWLTGLLHDYQQLILPIDEAVAVQCASFHSLNTPPTNDAFIAATALVHGLTVATRNVRDFPSLGVQVYNPWEYTS